ncbi:MFS transporter [Corynebacterium sanguinis]|uniref:MFS transporter n=1 Tax=Corynebacterium sanguinis TaxID=2594913 RepID=A0A6C1TYY5_9CORY|nr:MFS transporter [Corynebacterium sanguinis]MCT1463033.1 MFS transporter [Corynebacterium sanguinis]MCT1554850.1 MFS transporter [Corynebacterium sanguinis]MCT1664117.1 MFS transporter [Corynebacterium sanguinis]MCT1804266.1 MFS transporter [Corynebacterium sanguinis]MCT2158374.1 MFS transporter [Corynebacterium sanguinis]
MRWLLLSVLSTGLLLIGLDNSILYTALPTISAELGADEAQGLWIINAYPLVVAGLMLGTGTLGDKVGHARMFATGLVIFGVASLCCAYAPTPELLIAARGALGLGAAVMMPATLALVQQTFTNERERNTAIGIWASVATVGAAAGPLVGGFLLEHFWWGSIFLVNVPIVAAALVALALLRPANHPYPLARWDAVSTLLSILTLTGFTLVIKGHLLAAVPAGLGAWLFVRRQARLEHPLLTFDIFRNRIFSGGVVAAGFALTGLAAVELLTTQRFQIVAGYSPLEAGAIISAVVVASLPSSIIGGMVLHRVGFLPLISGGLFVAALGTLVAALSVQTLAVFLTAMLFVGAGIGAVGGVASTAIVGSAPPHREGMAASVEEISFELGALTGVALLGTLMSAIRARYDAPTTHPFTAYDMAYSTVLTIAAGILLASAIACAWLFRGNPKSPAR